MQQPWPACRSAKGGLYAWSQSTPNSIILERVSCVSSTERLFTCAEPRCYFASPSVFIMMALCLLVGGGYEHAIAWSSVILPYVFSMFCVTSGQCVCLQLSPRSLFWKFSYFTPVVTTLSCFSCLSFVNHDPCFWMIYLALQPVACVLVSSHTCRLLYLCFMCILWRMLPKQDMPNSVDQPRALSHHCFFCFFFSRPHICTILI